LANGSLFEVVLSNGGTETVVLREWGLITAGGGLLLLQGVGLGVPIEPGSDHIWAAPLSAFQKVLKKNQTVGVVGVVVWHTESDDVIALPLQGFERLSAVPAARPDERSLEVAAELTDGYRRTGQTYIVLGAWFIAIGVLVALSPVQPLWAVGLMLVFGGLFVGLGASMAHRTSASRRERARLVREGDTAIGEVISYSERHRKLASTVIGIGQTPHFSVVFRFRVNGAWYLGQSQFMPRDEAFRWRPGTSVRVVYDPGQPAVNFWGTPIAAGG
jgi:hypothetical protein